MAKRFEGSVALITGAARGIGAGVARGVVAEGGKVALIGLEPDLLSALADELGPAASWWEADVRDSQAMKTAIDAAAEHFGRIDYVLANAGIASYGTVRQIDDLAFERVVDININGVFRTLKYSTPYLAKSKGYALVVASQASFTPLAGLAAYNASKAGAETLGLAYKQEVAHMGVSVGICHPSWVDTDIVRNAEKDLPSFRKVRKQLPWPANGTTSVEKCVELILAGFAKRKARVYVPGKVMASNWTKALVNSPAVWPMLRKMSSRAVPSMEAEVDALGRYHHDHVPTPESFRG
jgi:NAD(P)-dependent dehydrogenase (short-subunit alcohol dehydrogenase family)